MNNLLLLTSQAEEAAQGNPLFSFLPLILIVVVFYFMLIRPQRKRDKQAKEMRSALEVGDEIITAGGIIGRVVSMRDDSVVIETGSDRSKVRIARWAIQANNTVKEASGDTTVEAK